MAFLPLCLENLSGKFGRRALTHGSGIVLRHSRYVLIPNAVDFRQQKSRRVQIFEKYRYNSAMETSDGNSFKQAMGRLRAGDQDAARALFERFVQRLIALAATRLPAVGNHRHRRSCGVHWLRPLRVRAAAPVLRLRRRERGNR